MIPYCPADITNKPNRMNVGVAVHSHKLYLDLFNVYEIEGQFIFII